MLSLLFKSDARFSGIIVFHGLWFCFPPVFRWAVFLQTIFPTSGRWFFCIFVSQTYINGLVHRALFRKRR
mgnify:CR=1 FL=1